MILDSEGTSQAIETKTQLSIACTGGVFSDALRPSPTLRLDSPSLFEYSGSQHYIGMHGM